MAAVASIRAAITAFAPACSPSAATTAEEATSATPGHPTPFAAPDSQTNLAATAFVGPKTSPDASTATSPTEETGPSAVTSPTAEAPTETGTGIATSILTVLAAGSLSPVANAATPGRSSLPAETGRVRPTYASKALATTCEAPTTTAPSAASFEEIPALATSLAPAGSAGSQTGSVAFEPTKAAAIVAASPCAQASAQAGGKMPAREGQTAVASTYG